ncbi:SGNH/GDSL hydrolase family protein [Photorhabdus heterorhabditis]|uniref:SGNH/GDSL hydrolase family protein n=3 Tax=Photorhabdus heterorhabditis TaxID=880156 RepID=A0A5B0WSB9_9GAMM|nr:SGNH/GDSL hydrolase family protein [Photorhabdus heterorhabditis]KAA1189816.1 SGNH/GDSL hydrolase family protein [Photorhabdus heterorhabditis]
MNKSNVNTEKLATFLSDNKEDALEVMRLAQIYLMSEDQNNNDAKFFNNIPSCSENIDGYTAIGTWHPEKIDGEIIFVRREQSDSIFWESSQQQLTLNKAKNVKRICFIGESVALGMLFSPHTTPAKTLAHLLNQHTDSEWEVIDLAKSSMSSGGLLETCKASLQLQPDYVVILAGNNWFGDVLFGHNPPLERRRNYASVLANSGPNGMAVEYKEKLEKNAEILINRIDAISKESGIEFIFALPAANYADWERKTPLHWLGNGKTAEWYELYRHASQAIMSGQYVEALELGLSMIGIDGGTAATSNRIVANSLIALNRAEEAKPYLDAECSYALMYDLITPLPSTPSFVKERILQQSVGIKIIDLEYYFAKYLGTSVLDDSLFIDYCHMTPEGFKVAMSSVAEWLINHGKDKSDVNWEIMAGEDIDLNVSSYDLAVSYFYTALYNSHINRPIDEVAERGRVVKLFDKAVQYSAEILDVMELYIKARSCERGAGFGLSQAGQKLLELVNSPHDFYIAQTSPGADAQTIDAICEILNKYGRHGHVLKEYYQKSYIDQLKYGVDLTEPQYIDRTSAVIMVSAEIELNTRRNVPYFKSWWPTSSFTLITSGNRDLNMVITSRVKKYIEESKVKILINGELLEEINPSSEWSLRQLIIPGSLTKPGFNTITLEWPKLAQDEEEEVLNISSRYNKGLKTEIFPVFGELFSLKVSYSE